MFNFCAFAVALIMIWSSELNISVMMYLLFPLLVKVNRWSKYRQLLRLRSYLLAQPLIWPVKRGKRMIWRWDIDHTRFTGMIHKINESVRDARLHRKQLKKWAVYWWLVPWQKKNVVPTRVKQSIVNIAAATKYLKSVFLVSEYKSIRDFRSVSRLLSLDPFSLHLIFSGKIINN